MKKMSFFCLISLFFSTHIWSLDLVIKKETKIKNPNILSDNGGHMIIQDDNGLTICELPSSHERELFLSKVKFLETNPTITEEKLAEILQLSFTSIEKIMGL